MKEITRAGPCANMICASGSGGARSRENSRPDDCTHSQQGELHRPETALELEMRLDSLANQLIRAVFDRKSLVTSSANVHKSHNPDQPFNSWRV